MSMNAPIPSRGGIALRTLALQPLDEQIIVPELYLKAAGETLFLTLVMCWILTITFLPEVVASNQLKNYVGYNNVCVGWDFAPANYIGIVGVTCMIFFSLRYCWLDALRTRLLGLTDMWQHQFALVTNGMFATTNVMLPLLFIVGPSDSNWPWHTYIFIFQIITRFLVVLGNYLEAPPEAREGPPTVFIWAYGAISTLLPILYVVSIVTYEAAGRTGVDPTIPWWITMTCDYLWFVCLVATSFMLPQSPPIRMRCEVLHDLRA